MRQVAQPTPLGIAPPAAFPPVNHALDRKVAEDQEDRAHAHVRAEPHSNEPHLGTEIPRRHSTSENSDDVEREDAVDVLSEVSAGSSVPDHGDTLPFAGVSRYRPQRARADHATLEAVNIRL